VWIRLPICTFGTAQLDPQITADGSGGVIIVWEDTRGFPWDAYAQRVDGSGNIQWTVDGVPVDLSFPSYQDYPVIASDGAGGAIIAWDAGGVQRLDGAGNAVWASGYVDVGLGVTRIISDGSGGAIVAGVIGTTNHDVYAQRLDGSGNPLWTTSPLLVSGATGMQLAPTLASDGSGGAIITWEDRRSGTDDIYAQHIDAGGIAQWTTDGDSVCTAANDQEVPEVIASGTGGAIIAWHDDRTTQLDIYAQRVGATATGIGHGALVAPLLRVRQNVPNPFGSATVIPIELSTTSPLALEVYDVAGRRVYVRRVPDVTAGSHRLLFDGRDAKGQRLASGIYFYRVRAGDAVVTRKMVVRR
jgi:hypothetical protein